MKCEIEPFMAKSAGLQDNPLLLLTLKVIPNI